MEQILTLQESLDTPTFYGVNNSNILCLKNQHPDVRVVARGYQVKVTGSEKAVGQFEQSLHLCENFCIRNNRLTEQDILMLLHGDQPHEQATDNLILHGVNGKSIYARSINQQALVKAYEENDLLFAVGPAGSGKTYTAIALAVRALKNREVRRIILSRPAVEAGEKLGFLPGDMKEKIDPYLQPLYDALQDMIPAAKLAEYMEKGTIQIAPLAFMRGRTLSDAIVILDEAQNTTALQLKMFLTRLGMGGKMIVTGDMTQIDLPPTQKSGLRDALERFKDIKGIRIIEFNEKDIVRHPLVKRIVAAYEKSKILCLAGLMALTGLAAEMQAGTVTYTPDNKTIFKNPERGFTDELSKKVSVEDPYVIKGEIGSTYGKKDNMSMAMILYNFGNFKEADLPDQILNAFDEDMQVLRDRGLKCVLRFAYTETQSDKVDATPEWVKRHLEQLKPHLKKNADVIYVLEAGFIGSWGEWYYTTHYTNESQTMNANRRKVIDYLFENAPEDRFILFRYPLIKIGYLGDEVPLTGEEAFTGTKRARMGCHNDAFLNNYGNDGTYGRDGDGPSDDPVLRQYIAAETKYVPNGGETNVESKTLAEKVYVQGPAEMSTYHWSFCGCSYSKQVTGRWRESGLFDTINIHMGYRYNLLEGQYSDSAAPGGKMNVTIKLRNDGYAPIYNERPVYLVLKGQGTEYKILLQTDPRRWTSNGEISVINEQPELPGQIQEGSYKLYLFMPDKYETLASDPRFAVRFANTGVWDDETGMNDLGAEVVVSGATSLDPGTLPDVEGMEESGLQHSPSKPRKILEDGVLYILMPDGRKLKMDN